MANNKIDYLRYDKNGLEIARHDKLDEIHIEDNSTNWVNINSLDYKDVLDSLVDKYQISPLVIEDIKNINTHSKVESYKDYVFMVVEDISLDGNSRIQIKQISLILFKDLLISVTEDDSNLFETIIEKLRDKLDTIEILADKIFYEIIDLTIENYFEFLEALGEKIDGVEDDLLISPDKKTLNQIYLLKRDLISFRKALWLMRNAANKLLRDELHYFREIHDDLIQLIDLTETYRDTCSGMLDIYLSSISNKTNDVMKFLTMFSTIFIPLTFIAGVYGMNFEHLPELKWKYGYIMFWLISLIVVAIMIRFFKKKKWM